MKTNKILRVIDLSVLTCTESRVQFLTVEETAKGHTYVYVGDAATTSILVWDVHRSRGWRVQLPKSVLDTNSQVTDAMYISLVHHPNSNSLLYITYLSSARMFSMRTEFLRRGFSTQGRLVDQGIKPAKMIILGVDGGTSIFFRYEDRSEVYRWDTQKEFKIENFVKVYNGQNGRRFATHVAPDY
ncbi:hypothetical protein B566_EDAN013819 [Ephemera danica]|nr:hypothetical protein B566_EDAN013819 [Ephemera danica]